MKKFLRKSKKGFTLVELVVVIAIIAILSGVSVAIYSGVTNKAKQSADSQVVSQLNLQLKAQSVYGKNVNAYEAYEDALDIGFDLTKMEPQYGDHYVWDQEHDLFAVMKGDEVVVQDSEVTLTEKNPQRWIFVDTISATEKRSQFLTDVTYSSAVNVISGFDAGNNVAVTAINYTSTVEQDVIIRTNSNDVTLTIDDSTNGKIYHYDNLGKLVVTKCGYGCYYEYGTTAYATATVGKLVAKEGGEISILYATAATVAAKEDGGVINEALCAATSDAEGDGYTTFSDGKEGNVTFEYKDENDNFLEPEDIKEEGSKAVLFAKDQEELIEINIAVAIDKSSFVGGNYDISKAVKAVYLAGYELVTKHDGYIYVFNKTTSKFEYWDKTKADELPSNYEDMQIVKTIPELDAALANGGMIYLQGSFDAAQETDSVFYVRKNTVIVGDNANLVVGSNVKDTTGISQYWDQKSPVFILADDNVSLSLCGVNVQGQSSTNSLVAVSANNCSIDILGCTLSGGQYLINVRNYACPGESYKNESDNSYKFATDAVCNVNVYNSKIYATGYSAVNWKFVGGSLTIDQSVLSQSAPGAATESGDHGALICNEGNGETMSIKNSSLSVASQLNSFVCSQYGAQNTTVTLENCTTNGNGKWNIITEDGEFKGDAGANNSIVVDGKVVASN